MIVNGHVKEVDLELKGALPTPTPIVINALGLHIDFGPKVAAKPECIKTVGLVETTPYDIYKALDYYIPVLRQLATEHPELYGSLFRKTFQNYPVPTFALCGHIELSLAEVLDADVGFGFARYNNPYPNLFFFHGKATIAKVINAEVNAEFTTEGYVHFDAAVKGGYPTANPWVKWDIGLDFEYFKKQFNAEAHAVIEIPPLDFTTGATCSSPTRASPPACTSRRSRARGGQAPARCGATARRCTSSAATSRTTRSSSSTLCPATR